MAELVEHGLEPLVAPSTLAQNAKDVGFKSHSRHGISLFHHTHDNSNG